MAEEPDEREQVTPGPEPVEVDKPPAMIAPPARPDLGDFAWAPRLRAERQAAGAPEITGIVHTRNEEHNLGDALRSLAWVDKWIVVDMESEDGTIEVAHEFGARVLTVPNLGYVLPARNAGVRAVDTPWIFTLDADERIPEGLARALTQIAGEDLADVVQVHWRNWIAGRFITASGWQESWHTRFFKKGAVEYGIRVHSVPTLNGRVGRVPYTPETGLVHFNYDSLTHFVTKLNRYTDREAEALAGEVPLSWPELANHLRREFSWHWTPAQDGPLSGALAMCMLFYRFMTQAKHWQNLGYPEIRGMPSDPGAALRDLASDGRFLHASGVVAAQSGKQDEAKDLLRQSIRSQLDLETLNDLAVMHAQSGEREEAILLLRVCGMIDPAYTPARENLAALER